MSCTSKRNQIHPVFSTSGRNGWDPADQAVEYAIYLIGVTMRDNTDVCKHCCIHEIITPECRHPDFLRLRGETKQFFYNMLTTWPTLLQGLIELRRRQIQKKDPLSEIFDTWKQETKQVFYQLCRSYEKPNEFLHSLQQKQFCKHQPVSKESFHAMTQKVQNIRFVRHEDLHPSQNQLFEILHHLQQHTRHPVPPYNPAADHQNLDIPTARPVSRWNY
jgi:hypothetical protein